MEQSSSPRADSSTAGTSDATQGTATNWLLQGTLYLWEFSGLLIILSLYTLGRKPNFFAFLSSRPGFLFIAGVLGIAFSSLAVARQYRRSKQDRSRTFGLTIAMNVLTLMILFVLGEGTIRAIYKQTSSGDVWGGTYLLPREWNKVVAFYTDHFRNTLGKPSYHIYDEVLGWTIGSNRSGEFDVWRSGYDPYFSSAEGLRSPLLGMAYADQPSTSRIALVGDSFTFGQEVTFEDSWGHQLERQLGGNVQVLNFGVMGYGIDQAYLRYVKDVRPWHPEVVIFGVINSDVTRAMGIYGFLTPWITPFAKPRFVMREQQLVLLNTPLPTPEQTFSARSVSDLPYIEYDRAYVPGEWDRSYWRVFHMSYLFRWMWTWFPLHEISREQISDESMNTIAREIFRSFVERVSADGAIPILVFFPDRTEVGEGELPPLSYVPLTLKVLQEAELEYQDMRPCLTRVPAADRFTKGGGHYSPKGNAAVASCLREVVTDHLRKRTHLRTPPPSSDRKLP